MKPVIGLSYAPKEIPKFGTYIVALEQAAAHEGYEIEIVDLSSDPAAVDRVDGIVFTGGADIDPVRFGKENERNVCDIDILRDAGEFSVIQRADERGLPMFGICRGLQLLNVHYGGTLITDLIREGLPDHSKMEGNDRRHEVHIEAGTLLKRLTRKIDSNVTSAHHQAIENVAPGMKASAHSVGDNIIEAIEWEDQQKKPFFLAVQWHPERMEYHEPLAGELFERFISEVAMNTVIARRK